MNPGDCIVEFGRVIFDGIIWDIMKALILRYVGFDWVKRVCDRVILNQPSTPVIWFRDPVKRVRVAATTLVITFVGLFSLAQGPELASDGLVAQKPPIQEVHGLITPRNEDDLTLRIRDSKQVVEKDGTIRVSMQPCTCVYSFPPKPTRSHK
jgi:hypothetical protein